MKSLVFFDILRKLPKLKIRASKLTNITSYEIFIEETYFVCMSTVFLNLILSIL